MNEGFYKRFGISTCLDVASCRTGLGLRIRRPDGLSAPHVPGRHSTDGVAVLRVPAQLCISDDLPGLLACPCAHAAAKTWSVTMLMQPPASRDHRQIWHIQQQN
jgi:hypothetical protein